MLDLLEPERESGPDFLHSHLFILAIDVIKNVSVSPDENEVALVVEGDHLAPLEFWILREEGCEGPGNAATQFGVEIVDDDLWVVDCGDSMVHNVLLVAEVGYFEGQRGADWEVDEY